MPLARRLLIILILVTLLLSSGTALAAPPELYDADHNLQGALIPGGEIIFTAKGTPGCVATLELTISGLSLPWKLPMREVEGEAGLYRYPWTVPEGMDVTLTNAEIKLIDRSGQTSGSLDVIEKGGGSLTIGGEIRGKITDALTALPLAGIRVMAYSASTRHFALTTTNQRGEYTLPGLGTGRDYQLWTANDLGYSEAKEEKLKVYNGISTDHIDLALSGLSAITGMIDDEEGALLVGVTVIAEQLDGSSRTTVVTDNQGRFTIPGLPPGGYDLQASLGGAAGTAHVEARADKIATASFRLVTPKPLSGCAIAVPSAGHGPDQIAYWPRRGGPVRLAPLAEDETATLSDLTRGEALVLSLMVEGQPLTYYALRPMDQGPYHLGEPWDSQEPEAATLSLTFTPPLTTRGGSAWFSGSAIGAEWVDLIADDQPPVRLPVTAGRWQANLSLDQGEHQVTVMAVGPVSPLKAERRFVVDRALPAVLQLKVNQKPYPSWLSGDGGGEIQVAPKQPVTLLLTATQVGTVNWLKVGERQWVMGKLNQLVTATIPADAMVEGEHPLIWRWESQGKQGEVPLGSLIVRNPIVRTIIDAITGEPVAGMTIILEQLTDVGWKLAAATPLITDAHGQISLWLADQEFYRLRLTKPGYQAKVSPLDPAATAQERVIAMMPIRPDGPISFSPGRDAKDVKPADPITVAFARDLAPKSLNTATFYIHGVPAKEVSYDPLTRKATLKPSVKLSEGSQYLVHLSGTIRYADGTPLGRDLWWRFSVPVRGSVTPSTTEEEHSSGSSLTPAGQATTLAPRDGGAKATIPAGSAPVQTLYRLTRPSTLPKALPSGWRAVTAPLSFTATNSPLDKPIHMLQQGTEIAIFYTDPPTDDQATTLWRYDTVALTWVEHPYEHDPYLRTVRFTTDRPGTFVFAKQQ